MKILTEQMFFYGYLSKCSARYCLCNLCLQNSKNSISRVKFFLTMFFVSSATGGLYIFLFILEKTLISSEKGFLDLIF